MSSKYGIYRHIRFGVEVERAQFDTENNLWVVSLASGEKLRGRHLISACGGLISPKLPDIEGLDAFEGEVIHTARWPEDMDLPGKRVAVIGTGATAVQLVPEIARQAKQLDVYQRTPIWVLKKPDRILPGWLKSLFRALPSLQGGVRGITDVASETLMVLSAIYYRQAPWIVRACEKAALDNMREQLPGRQDLWEKLSRPMALVANGPPFPTSTSQRSPATVSSWSPLPSVASPDRASPPVSASREALMYWCLPPATRPSKRAISPHSS